MFERLADALRRDEPVALATRLDGAAIGAKLLVCKGAAQGSLGNADLDRAVCEEARALLAAGETVVRTFGAAGEPLHSDVRVFIQSFAPKPDMYIFGAVDFSRAMVHVGKYLGYRVTIVDARPVFATAARFPEADRVVVAWPHEFLASALLDERSVIVVLTHDEKFDIPLLAAALKTNSAYIGAMGSRATQRRRVEQLRALGIDQSELARICAPIGLDLGARTPEETAISIAAEIVALRGGRSGGRLSTGAGPVHGALRDHAWSSTTLSK